MTANFKNFATTLEATRLYDGTVISYAGLMKYPDMAAEMADLLLRLGKIEWVICDGADQTISSCLPRFVFLWQKLYIPSPFTTHFTDFWDTF
jgi:hypothetical protein